MDMNATKELASLERLPPEIMGLIIDGLVGETTGYWRRREAFPNLRNLRLVCTRWSYLPYLMQLLFKGIEFKASLKHLRSLEKYDIRPIAPYVERIVFMPALEGCSLDYDHFREIIITQAIQKRSADLNIDGYWSLSHGEDSYDRFVQAYWDGQFPLSDEQIRHGFEEYQRLSKETLEVLESGRWRRMWATALKSLERCNRVKLCPIEWDCKESNHLPAEPDAVLCDHMHTRNHPVERCAGAATTLPESVLRVAFEALADAGTSIRHLSVKSEVGTHVAWKSIPGWDELDLRQLHTFKIEPLLVNRADLENVYRSELVEGAIQAVLEKSRDSLAYFHCKCDLVQSETWPGSDVVSLPALRHLSLRVDCISSVNLARWIALMPSLTRLELESMRLHERYASWRLVYDAIRDHPRDMFVEFGQIIINDGAELSLSVHTSDFEQYVGLEDLDDIAEESDDHVSAYLCGQIGWTRGLAEFHQDSEFEDDDDDDEDDDGND